MTLCDTGPLIALINAEDRQHQQCKKMIPQLIGPLVTTWPCFTEAMYLARRHGGYVAQVELWSYFNDDIVKLRAQSEDDQTRIRHLMEQYRDIPMDFADASLVAMAENFGVRRIFTLDSHFHVYRMNQREPFIVLP